MLPIIEVNNLYKKYRIGEKQRYYSFRDTLVDLAKLPFNQKAKSNKGEFWALKDISFNVMPGEIIGIIGRNGAGKSTLLKILSRITPPTKGEITLRGRVASLLEVGTGFHPELTGRENIYLNGAILGMKRVEINDKFDEIVEFAEISKFLDTPVKFYSSGMYMRLAFAIAAHLDPEILLVDEVLAVGDIEFQKKCLGKMGEIARVGRTVLFVSHNLGAVTQLCTKGIYLDKGTIKSQGEVHQVISDYSNSRYRKKLYKQRFSGPLTNCVEVKKIEINGKSNNANFLISPSIGIKLTVTGIAKKNISLMKINFSIYKNEIRLFTMHDVLKPQLLKKGVFTSEVVIPAYCLRPGEYSLAVGGYRDGMIEWFWGTNLAYFTIAEEWKEGYDSYNIGLINIPFNGYRSTS